MFSNCKLEHFEGDLSSLESAWGMFGYCNLDKDSVLSIADSINTVD